MKQAISHILALCTACLAFGACDIGVGVEHDRGSAYDPCNRFPSCGACTPIAGCGWCYMGNGTGLCASSPGECAAVTFSWTWEPTGCVIPADASVAPTSDAGSSSTDAGPIDAGAADGDTDGG